MRVSESVQVWSGENSAWHTVDTVSADINQKSPRLFFYYYFKSSLEDMFFEKLLLILEREEERRRERKLSVASHMCPD